MNALSSRRLFSDRFRWLKLDEEKAEQAVEEARAKVEAERPPEPPEYTIGLDLGQAADYSALAIAERTLNPKGEPTYGIRHLTRWPLGTSYSVIARDVADLAYHPDLLMPRLAIDGTGVGPPVVEMVATAIESKATGDVRPELSAITITGGHAATQLGYGKWNVSKILLVGTLQALFSSDRLGIANDLPEAETLVRELKAFKAKVTLAGNETFASWREKDHDDLVLATALAVWSGENAPRGVLGIHC